MLSRIIILGLIVALSARGADVKIAISSLPAATSATTNDLVPVVQNGITKRSTVGQFLSALTAGGITNALGLTGSTATFLRSDGQQVAPPGVGSDNWTASGGVDSTLHGRASVDSLVSTNGIFPLNVAANKLTATDGSGKLVTATLVNVTNALGLTGSTLTFLRSDGTQVVPPGGGGGSLTNLTTQGDLLSFDGINLLRIPLGAAGSVVESVGGNVAWSLNGASLQNLNASQLGSGTVPDARLAGANPVFATVGTTGAGAAGNITLFDTAGTHSIRITAAGSISTNSNLILPTTPNNGVGHYVLTAGTNLTLSISPIVDADIGTFTVSTITAGADGTFPLSSGGNVGWSFNGSTIQSLNASQLASGTVPDARLNGANPIFASVSVTNTSAGALTLADTNNTHSVRFVAPNVVATNINFILPDRPSSGVLKATLTGGTNATLTIVPNVSSVGFTVDGGGSAITSGKVKGFFTCPYAATISAWNIVVDTGTVTIKCWKIATGTAKPTASNSINTSGVALSSGSAIHSTTLSDFTSTAVTAGDIFAFNIESVASATELSFSLELTR